MELKLVLEDYGLTDKEATVYLTLLPLGNINLQEIARRVDYPRTTVYNTLTYLAQKGLISKIVKEGVTFFQAVDPRKLVEMLEQKKRRIDNALPELEALKQTIQEMSSVEIYEGSKGLFTVLSDIFKVKQPLYYFGSYSRSLKILKHQPAHFRTLRLERKIPAKIIIEPYDEPVFHSQEYRRITEMRFWEGLKDFPCMIFIYGNKVALYTLQGDLIGIIIKNEQVVKAMKIVFDTYWMMARPVKE